jgi:arylsulfatase A-like enzyme
MDILPTMTAMASGTLPTNKIDGHDILPILQSQPGATTPYKWFYYFWPDELQAVRSGKWKLHVPHNHRHQIEPAGKNGEPAGEVTEKIGLSLYNLETDPGETKNVAEDHPDIVSRMLRMIQIGRNELGDKITKTKGSEVRSPGEVIFPPQPADIKKL